MASPSDVTMSKVKGGIGAISDHLLAQFEAAGGELRRHLKVTGIAVESGRATGVVLGDGERIAVPVVVSNLDPTATFDHLVGRDGLPDDFTRRIGAIDHRALYFQMHFALSGLSEYIGRYKGLNEGYARQNVTFFGTPEQMQEDFLGRTRGVVPAAPSVNLPIPSLRDPDLAPPGKHVASSFAFYAPIGADHDEAAALRDEMADRIAARNTAHAPNFQGLIERQFNYPAYTYERMFSCTGGDFTHGLLQPEFMGPFRPGP
jgi:phytoene dehydrogenase-like protein